MRTSLFAIAALAIGLASPAIAGSYSASLTAPASGKIIARDIVWLCGAAACQGSTDAGQPVVLCQSLAKRAGHVDSFLANGRALSASELERCNALAKPTPNSALAAK